MTIARMWESRLAPGAAEELAAHLVGIAWPALTAAPGFQGGEAYRSSGDEERAVVVTRWADEASAAGGAEVERGLARFCAGEPHAWQFEQLEIGPAEEVPRH
ncbi:MAG: antibiotic biosynthesis monooxygenase family protein [Frankiaceae bacterium]